jgi:hypothetical protein
MSLFYYYGVEERAISAAGANHGRIVRRRARARKTLWCSASHLGAEPDTKGRCPAARRGRTIVAFLQTPPEEGIMDNSIHSIVAAQLIRDRIAAATAEHQAREVRARYRSEPGMSAVQRWLRHGKGIAEPTQPPGLVPRH